MQRTQLRPTQDVVKTKSAREISVSGRLITRIIKSLFLARREILSSVSQPRPGIKEADRTPSKPHETAVSVASLGNETPGYPVRVLLLSRPTGCSNLLQRTAGRRAGPSAARDLGGGSAHC